jgi:small-conductance mechanosensitive channel
MDLWHRTRVKPPRTRGRIAGSALLLVALAARPAFAHGAGGSADLDWLPLALALLFAGVVAHWALGRLGRRLPLALARRAAPGVRIPLSGGLPWQRAILLGTMLAKLVLWLVIARFLIEAVPALGFLSSTTTSLVEMSVRAPIITLDNRSYTALDVVLLPAVLGAFWIAMSALTRVANARLRRLTGMPGGAQDVLALLVHYVLAFLGSIVILQIWGIDVRNLALIASVLGVGIGFGLQHIANNFVSGLLINLERPIRPGDVVNVAGLTGVVQRIGARSTEIRTEDRVTILIPNSKFLETEVVNWTYGDPVSRLHVPVAVAYGSRITAVRQALLAAAQHHPDVLRDPRPEVHFRAFGASALEFELLIWTRDPSRQWTLISDLNYRVESQLRRHGIAVPFPQQDVHVHAPLAERALAAWAKRELGDEAFALPAERVHGAAAAHDAAVPEDEFEGDHAWRRWTPADIEAVVARMRGADGIAIHDRRHLLKTYPRCFVGSEAVDWLVRNEGLNRAEALMLGQALVERNVIHHVLDEHGFHDGNFFYRFREDDAASDPAARSTEHG